MPLNMAMEDPNTGVIGSETHDEMAIRSHEDDVSSHGFGWVHHRAIGHGFRIEVARFFFTAKDRLESMAV